MSNVLAFKPRAEDPAPELERATFDVAWRELTDTMRRRSEAKAKCQALWNREAKRLGGQEDLLGRLRTYLRDDRDIVKTGGPGLQVLLRAGRLEHWAPMQQQPRLHEMFPHTEARAAVAKIFGEGFCRSYLDPCEVSGTTIIARTDIAIKKLREAGVALKTHGFTGVKRSPVNAGNNRGTS